MKNKDAMDLRRKWFVCCAVLTCAKRGLENPSISTEIRREYQQVVDAREAESRDIFDRARERSISLIS
jgi:hypothetical protein